MTQVWGEVLPAAVAVALSPFPVVGVILVLGSPRARVSGPAYGLGWVLGLGALTGLLAVLTDGADDPSGTTATGVGWAELVLGLVLLGLAAKAWRGRPGPGEEPSTPGWMAGIDGAGPGRALVLGAALGGANPKNVAFTLSAVASIAEVGATGTDAVLGLVAYVLLASLTVLGAVAYRLLLGDRAAAGLTVVRELMTVHNAAIVTVVLTLFGAKLVGDGLADLWR